MRKCKDKIRALTHRCHGHSLPVIISRLNPILRGWFGYYKHSNRHTFTGMDGWVRMRLRSILRKRSGRRGRACGKDHHRWPNAYFRQLGLFLLVDAYAVPRQSLRSTC